MRPRLTPARTYLIERRKVPWHTKVLDLAEDCKFCRFAEVTPDSITVVRKR